MFEYAHNEPSNPPVISTNTLKIDGNKLQCQANRIPTDAINFPQQTQTVLEDVEAMQVLYGENTDGDLHWGGGPLCFQGQVWATGKKW